jgi:hypothetical protein
MLDVLMLGALISASADAATAYRCRNVQGNLSYQDLPCGPEPERNIVRLRELSVVHNARAESLAQWVDQVDRDNRQRELQSQVANLQREKRADTAEFAAMVEDLDKRREALEQGGADLPPSWQIEQEERRAEREYGDRMREHDAKLQAVQRDFNRSEPR